ncbi:MAG TPA: hypothetical protein VLH75_09315 [Longimicrobiales bacterium]|nr:hypothetical protein [Longimicrobiales bacterium]
MSLPAAGPATLARYDALCALLAERGRGRTMLDLGTAWELAGALEAPSPDPATVAALTERLGLDVREAA